MAKRIPLAHGYYALAQDRAAFRPFFLAHVNIVFGPNESIDLDKLLAEDERTAMATLREKMGDPIRLYYGVFSPDGQQIGWSFGFQTDAECFYMCNTGILEAHRGKGLYTALLPALVADIAALGFQVIFSRHTVTNNAVLVPKLRAGFIITQMELNDRFGTLVHLRYFTNPHRRHLMDYRCGQAGLSDAVKALLAVDAKDNG